MKTIVSWASLPMFYPVGDIAISTLRRNLNSLSNQPYSTMTSNGTTKSRKRRRKRKVISLPFFFLHQNTNQKLINIRTFNSHHTTYERWKYQGRKENEVDVRQKGDDDLDLYPSFTRRLNYILHTIIAVSTIS